LTKLPVLSAREVVSRLRRLCFKEVATEWFSHYTGEGQRRGFDDPLSP
jgi:predicted RNA binding protein YcfA (HicA-like mRNA interferase family)